MEELSLSVVSWKPFQKAVADGTVSDARALAYVRGGQLDGKLIASADTGDAGPQALSLVEQEAYFMPWPTVGERDVYYVTGPSGVGKSTWMRRCIETWQLATRATSPPGAKMPVFIVSPHQRAKDDPALRGLDGVAVLSADADLNQIELEHLNPDGGPSLVAFDDVEALSDKGDQQAVMRLMQSALEVGRKLRVTVIVLMHRAASGVASRLPLLEMNWFVCFRAAIPAATYCLTKHLGLKPETISLLRKKEFGRYLCLTHNSAPQAVVGERRCALFDNEEAARAVKRAEKTAKAGAVVMPALGVL